MAALIHIGKALVLAGKRDLGTFFPVGLNNQELSVLLLVPFLWGALVLITVTRGLKITVYGLPSRDESAQRAGYN